MFNDLISVVVPIYRVEKFLKRCVDSILNQTYKNIEVILVDDGSPDNCGLMCDEYKKQDHRVKVIHKANGGLSDARNYGTELASGNYITYIDSDDWVAEDYIEVLFKVIKHTNSDISVFPLHYVYPDKKDNIFICLQNNDIKDVKCFDNCTAIEHMFYQKMFDCCAPGKLYKTPLMKAIQFPKGKLYEDLFTTYKVFSNVNKIAFLDTNKYYYWQNQDSIMYQKFNKRRFDAVEAVDEIELFIINKYPNIISSALSKKFSNYCFVLKKLPLNSTDNEIYQMQLKIWSFIKSYRIKMILDSKSRIKNRFAAMLTFLGITLFKLIASKI